jgi:hypothetical protein
MRWCHYIRDDSMPWSMKELSRTDSCDSRGGAVSQAAQAEQGGIPNVLPQSKGKKKKKRGVRVLTLGQVMRRFLFLGGRGRTILCPAPVLVSLVATCNHRRNHSAPPRLPHKQNQDQAYEDQTTRDRGRTTELTHTIHNDCRTKHTTDAYVSWRGLVTLVSRLVMM